MGWMNWKSWITDTTFFFLTALAGWFWLLWRFEQLRKQLKAVCDVLQMEIAQSAGNMERYNELRQEWRENRAEEKMQERRSWIVLGFWVAVGFAYWWYTVGQH
jgi:hypothetical protein